MLASPKGRSRLPGRAIFSKTDLRRPEAPGNLLESAVFREVNMRRRDVLGLLLMGGPLSKTIAPTSSRLPDQRAPER